MRRYHVTIAGRFPKSSVDQGLATFRKQFTQRGAWDEGLSGLREELGNVSLSVSSEFEAASPRAAVMQALKAYEDDAHASIGHLNAMETHVQPADEMRGTTLRRTHWRAVAARKSQSALVDKSRVVVAFARPRSYGHRPGLQQSHRLPEHGSRQPPTPAR